MLKYSNNKKDIYELKKLEMDFLIHIINDKKFLLLIYNNFKKIDLKYYHLKHILNFFNIRYLEKFYKDKKIMDFLESWIKFNKEFIFYYENDKIDKLMNLLKSKIHYKLNIKNKIYMFDYDTNFKINYQQINKIINLNDFNNKEKIIIERKKAIIIKNNLSLVYKNIHSFNKIRNFHFEDALAEGVIGLNEAIDRYNGLGNFSTYASFWIKKFIHIYICNMCFTYRLPRTLVEKGLSKEFINRANSISLEDLKFEDCEIKKIEPINMNKSNDINFNKKINKSLSLFLLNGYYFK